MSTSSLSQNNYVTIIVIFIVFSTANETFGHGRFMHPPSRSSIWRNPQYDSYNPPVNYNDDELYCGETHQKRNPGRQCGVCGDAISDTVPRPNEIGGTWYSGIITEKYTVGQVIEVLIHMTTSHDGFMEWRLCHDHRSEHQDCFNKNLLMKADGSGSRVPVTTEGWYKVELILPSSVVCSHCVIQWNYRTASDWGICKDGSGGQGCGSQETFRGCSDVAILPGNIRRKKTKPSRPLDIDMYRKE